MLNIDFKNINSKYFRMFFLNHEINYYNFNQVSQGLDLKDVTLIKFLTFSVLEPEKYKQNILGVVKGK